MNRKAKEFVLSYSRLLALLSLFLSSNFTSTFALCRDLFVLPSPAPRNNGPVSLAAKENAENVKRIISVNM